MSFSSSFRIRKSLASISLQKLISKKEVSSIINGLIKGMDTPISVWDKTGNLLMGKFYNHSLDKYPVKLSDEIIGWVVGGESASSIASLLSYLSSKQLQEKMLARETLDKYKEINLLYKISEQFTACLDLNEVAKLVIDEASRLIEANSGFVLLLNPETKELDIIAASGQENNFQAAIELEKKIANRVIITGKAEIVNDVQTDSIVFNNDAWIHSLICAPLQTKEGVIGAIGLSDREPVNYTAADLKLLTTLASQAASAIENALLHENKLKEERIKSHLERYVSAQIVEAILEAKGNALFSPSKRHISILFSDIRNFTTKCEELEPEKIVDYLNEYFTHMVDVIFSHGGTVNKFVGDMIVAMFGAPSKLVYSECCAIETAIGMQKRIKAIPVPWIRNNFGSSLLGMPNYQLKRMRSVISRNFPQFSASAAPSNSNNAQNSCRARILGIA